MTPKRSAEAIHVINNGADSLDMVELSIELEEDIIAENGVTDTIGQVLRHVRENKPETYKALQADMDKRALDWIKSWEAFEDRDRAES